MFKIVSYDSSVEAKTGWMSSDFVMEAAKTLDSDLRGFVEDINSNPVFANRQYVIRNEDDIIAGPNFKKVSETKPLPTFTPMNPEDSAAHTTFIAQQSGLEFDWWGDSNGDDEWWNSIVKSGRKSAGSWWSGTDNEVIEAVYKNDQSRLGFYKKLQIQKEKNLSVIGASEMSTIDSFRLRLRQMMENYQKMGYKLHATISPKPDAPPDPIGGLISAVKWLSGGLIAGAAVYLVYRFVPKTTSLPEVKI